MMRPRAYGEMADEALVAWSAQGDRQAFDEIVTRHGPFALRVARRLIADPLVAENVVQEAMVCAWSQAGRFEPERARFTTWLYRIVVNLRIDQKRRVQPEPLPEDFELADPAAGTDVMLEVNERRAALAGALRGLPARQRAAMALVYDEGLSAAEAARILGCRRRRSSGCWHGPRACLRELLGKCGLRGLRRGRADAGGVRGGRAAWADGAGVAGRRGGVHVVPAARYHLQAMRVGPG